MGELLQAIIDFLGLNLIFDSVSDAVWAIIEQVFGSSFEQLNASFSQNVLAGIAELLANYSNMLINVLFYDYLIAALFILDLIASGFGMLSGTAPIQVKVNGGWQSEYITNVLFTGNSAVSKAYWGITIVAAALCIAFAVYAIIRSMADLEGKRPVGRVLGGAVRALLIYLLIPPIICAGMHLSSLVINKTAEAISGQEGDASVGTQIYVAVMRDAIRTRVPGESELAAEIIYSVLINGTLSALQGPAGMIKERIKVMYIAASMAVDYGTELKTFPRLRKLVAEAKNDADKLKRLVVAEYLSGEGSKFSKALGFSSMPYLDPYYNLQFLRVERVHSVLGIFCAFCFFVFMIMAAYIAVKRIFEIIVLYIVSPYFVAAIPLDDGELFRKWRDMFIVRIILGAGLVVGVRLFLLLVPLFFSRDIRFSQLIILDDGIRIVLLLASVSAVLKTHSLLTKTLEHGLYLPGQVSQSSLGHETAASGIGEKVYNAPSKAASYPVKKVGGKAVDSVKKRAYGGILKQAAGAVSGFAVKSGAVAQQAANVTKNQPSPDVGKTFKGSSVNLSNNASKLGDGNNRQGRMTQKLKTLPQKPTVPQTK